MPDVRNNETASNDASPDETRSIFQPDCQHKEGATDKNSLVPIVANATLSTIDNTTIPINSVLGPIVANPKNAKVKGRLSNVSLDRIGKIIAGTLRPIEVMLESMSAGCDGLCAEMQNFDHRSWNRMVIAATFYLKNPSLIPLLKTVNGFGPGLPRYPISIMDIPKHAPYTAGSKMPVRLFPTTLRMLQKISYKRLSKLAAMYNNDFGIVANDDLLVCRRKFERFIS